MANDNPKRWLGRRRSGWPNRLAAPPPHPRQRAAGRRTCRLFTPCPCPCPPPSGHTTLPSAHDPRADAAPLALDPRIETKRTAQAGPTPTPTPESSPAPELPTVVRYTVAVRALCEFTAKRGDLDLRFAPSATALEGQAGHLLAAARRGPDYEAELALSADIGSLRVRGRADGYDARANRLDEVKTYRGDLSAMPANRRHLHRAQALVYGALLCRARQIEVLDIAVVYLDVTTQAETVETERHSAQALEQHLLGLCQAFDAWARQELAHRRDRNAGLAGLPFPHADFRAGQRTLSEAVYRATLSGRCLLAEAPTGIGKTVGTLFPMLRAWPVRQLDKLCFLTAKTPGRAVALQALRRLCAAPAVPETTGIAQPLRLRVLELVARDKACEHPDKACHGESCPLARGFFDRLAAARHAALHLDPPALLDKATLRAVALAHQVCPYHLGHELVRWADVIVGDYNHYFDTHALLHGLAQADEWRLALLIDEAHNLVERARAMHSGALSWSTLAAVALRPGLPASVRGSLSRLARQWTAWHDRVWAEAEAPAYTVHDELPEPVALALKNLLSAVGDLLARERELDPALMALYFDALHLSRMIDQHGPHSLIELRRDEANPPADLAAPSGAEHAPLFGPSVATDSTLALRNVVPARFLKPRLAACQAVTLFSATLQPTRYHHDLLGLPDDRIDLQVPPPFKAEQLQVRLATRVSTRWAARDASVAPIARLMASQFAQRPGNYLAFFSSFDYLHRVADRLTHDAPDITVWRQARTMDEAAREAFLDRFQPHDQGIGFAVLGGAFAEGVDLPGRRLIGAFITTLGLPQWNPMNEQLRERMDACFGAEFGHDYTYLFPGLQKVVQAAGRVIRTPEDEGVVWLIDDRYRRPAVQRLLPQWWHVEGRDTPAG